MKTTIFLGLDLSTQSLKIAAIDANLRQLAEYDTVFDRDLPEFGTSGGAIHHPDGLGVTSPPEMWVAALDLVLDKMRKDSFPFERVVAISGSGQQHGSVYLREGWVDIVTKADPDKPLREQTGDMFTVQQSPIWMDSSTSNECQARDRAMGGAQAVAEITGSRSYERFTGNQIAKIFSTMPEAYEATSNISLVSSFMASIVSGGCVPIDTADASGMNLMDIREKTWNPTALECTAPGLAGKLGDPVPAHKVVGKVSPYLCNRYGFAESCAVVAFSGDNPNSLAALRLSEPGHVAVSMGTSDTMFAALRHPSPSADEGHIFVNPVDPEGYMALICYKNGSLTREWIRNRFASGSWSEFDKALESTPPGNGNAMGFFFKEPEITPPVMKTGMFTFRDDNECDDFSTPENVRAVVEGQFLSMRLHSRNIGIEPSRILATGGASVNKSILRVMADVLEAPVYTSDQPNTASLGAAYRAAHGYTCSQQQRFVPFSEVTKGVPSPELAVEPDKSVTPVYDSLLERYARLEKRLIP